VTPLRIAAHISAAEWGGAERRSIALHAGLSRRGHDVVVYCNTSRIAVAARAAGLRALISRLRGDVMIGNALALARHLRRQRPDVLILVTFRRLLLGALAGRLARVPRIISRVGLASDVARSAKYRFVLRRWIDDVVVNADSLREPFIAALPTGANVRVSVIANGVEPRPADTSRELARRALDIPPDAFVVGSVGRLVKQKRFDRLLRAVGTLDGVHAVIAGDGYQRTGLGELADSLGIARRVHFTGHREDVGAVHSALDVYVVASDQEGMSSGMLEAMAAGVPVISTDVSGAREALEADPRSGIVVERSAEALARAIDTLRDDPVARSEFAAAAALAARRRYGFDRMVDDWESVLLAHHVPLA
jgi:glycosyltransferase involved in cell wall biosynthesis